MMFYFYLSIYKNTGYNNIMTTISKNYLENDICNFKPLFKIDYKKKKNIYSAVFFKPKNGFHKNFEIYYQGLKKLYSYIYQNYKDYSLRLFIDKSIYNDKDIFPELEKLNKMEIVVYECCDFKNKNKDNFHLGLFGTIVRFFPMFNFKNNDAKIVKIIDIDFKYKTQQFNQNLNDNLNIALQFDKNIYFYADTRIFHHCISANVSKYGHIIPYIISSKIISVKRLNTQPLIKYILETKNKNSLNTNYKQNGQSKYEKYIFGFDEYFLNHDLLKYCIENNKKFMISYRYYFLSPFFWFNELGIEKNKNKMNQYLNDILDISKKNNKNENNDYSMQNKINILDKLFYLENGQNKNNNKMEKILKNTNELYQYIKNNKLYNELLTKDFINIALSKPMIVDQNVFSLINGKKNIDFIDL